MEGLVLVFLESSIVSWICVLRFACGFRSGPSFFACSPPKGGMTMNVKNFLAKVGLTGGRESHFTIEAMGRFN